MKCKNCQSEMEEYASNLHWCSECGTVLFNDIKPQEYWLFPKSIETTKKLVAELIKCRDSRSSLNTRLNAIDRVDSDRVDFSDER